MTRYRHTQFGWAIATSLIVPPLLKRVWEIDNNKAKILWEVGQLGGVSGDCFIKVAYEEPFVDPTGAIHPGRVRILPLNPAFCFPEFHPHDRTRLNRFKLKYKFWGTGQDGTRSVYTYVELVTETEIEEYVNDDLIDRRDNPLGVIPIIHIPNIPVASSPWGLGDINDIILEDASPSEGLQAMLNSGALTHFTMNDEEILLRHLHKTVADYVEAGEAGR